MCRECCEYDQIECICPGQKERVGYTIPCCRNEENECDSCLIHPGMFPAVLRSHQIFGHGIMADAEQAYLTEAWDCPAFPQELHLPLCWQQQDTWQGSPIAGNITAQNEKTHFLPAVSSSGCLGQAWELPKGDTIAGFIPRVFWWCSGMICIPKTRKERQLGSLTSKEEKEKWKVRGGESRRS